MKNRGCFNFSSAETKRLITGPVIEGFEDCALGEFVRAQLEAISQDGEPPPRCEVHGLDPFLEMAEPEQAARLRDLISVCEFRANEFTPESAVRFLKESGFSNLIKINRMVNLDEIPLLGTGKTDYKILKNMI